MKVAVVVGCVLASGCAHRPSRIAWSDIELGHGTCGARAQLDVVLDRACTLIVRANGERPRREAIDGADCRALLAMAANRAAHAHAPCTVPQPFIAGVAVTFDDGRTASACWDDALASRMAKLGEQRAPDWRRGFGTQATCDFTEGVIQGELVGPGSSP